MRLSCEKCGLPSKGRQGQGSSLSDMGGQLRVVLPVVGWTLILQARYHPIPHEPEKVVSCVKCLDSDPCCCLLLTIVVSSPELILGIAIVLAVTMYEVRVAMGRSLDRTL
jgi:hypothetical protein